MPIDRSEAREEALYAGLGDDAPHRPRPRQPPRKRRRNTRRRDMVVGGVVLSLGLGIMAGAVILPEMRPELTARSSAPAPRPALRVAPPPQLAPLQPAPNQSVLPASVPVAPVLPQAPPTADAPPAEAAPPMAAPAPASAPPVAAPPAAARRTRIAVAPTPPKTAPLPETGGRLALPRDAATPTPAPARPPAVVAPPRAAQTTASFDCANAEPATAEQMVCSDPELAAADRELAQAYGRAMRSGAVDPQDLDLDQRDWAALREGAARHSRKALASVYAHRIDELNEIADDGPHGDP